MPFWLVYREIYGKDFLTPSFVIYISKYHHHQGTWIDSDIEIIQPTSREERISANLKDKIMLQFVGQEVYMI
jgi:hypothetical protein